MGTEPIAIVGMAARVPDAGSVDEFWANLLASRNSIHRLSERQLLDAGEDPARIAQPNYVAARPLLDDVWGFDNVYFGVSRRESELRNPQHRLFLELCETALQSSGTVPDRFDGAIGVYGGCASDRFVEDHIRADPQLYEQVGEMVALVSNTVDYLASYVSFRLGLRGPSVAVRTACSTSLVAIHLACQALRAGDCDLALAGGVEIETPYGRGYLHVEGGIDAEDGVCRPLDAQASGTVFGSGGGVVALKRLSDAQQDGDHVVAVIRGSAVNNDGPDRAAFTNPSWEGQSEVVAEAITVSEVDPSTISYVELHGTGTKVGDPIELRGLHEGMKLAAHGELTGPGCVIGSVKSNLGHLGPASGVVGLIKTALALRHQTIPPTINLREVNPNLELHRTRFLVADTVRRWPRMPDAPRRAAVSSFGFGGTNAHAVLEEAPQRAPGVPADGPELLVWSATDDETLARVEVELLRTAAEAGDAELAAVAYTSRTGRRPLRKRAALRVADAGAVRRALTERGAVVRGDGEARPAVFLLPGQGAQFPRMGLDTDRWLPGFRDGVRRHLAVFNDRLGIDLVRVWEGEHDPATLARTVHTQPLLFSVELALVESLAELGVRPAALLGHSVGELVAATAAGVFQPEEAIQLVAERARLMQQMPPGVMLAVAAPVDEVRELLGAQVWLSATNAPDQTVVGGPAERIEALAAALAERRIGCRRLVTSHAFHTPMMDDAVPGCLAVAERLKLAPPTVPVVSAASGRLLTAAEAADPTFWSGQVARPVLLAEAMEQLPVRNAILVEVGPGATLTSLARRHPGVRAAGHVSVELLSARPGRHVVDGIAALWVTGADVDLSRLPGPTPPRKYPLPTYPYRRTEFLLPDRSAARTTPPAAGPAQAGDGAPVAQAGGGAPAAPAGGEPVIALPVWRPAGVLPPAAPRPPGAAGHAVVLLPDDAGAAVTVRRIVQQAGYRVLPIRVADRFEIQEYGGTVRDGVPEELDAALDALAGAGGVSLLVDGRAGATVDGVDGRAEPRRAEAMVLSLLRVQRYAVRARQARSRDLPVLVLTEGAARVTAAEPLSPARAALTAVVRSAVLEYGPGTARMLDLARPAESAVAAEIAAPAFPDPVLAIRGNEVWRPGRERLPLPERTATLLQPDGRYVITGGLGEVGLAVARGLADTGLQPKLVLVSRRAPERHDQATRGRIAELELAGAEVTVIRGDVSDREQVTALFARIAEQYGPVDGILHTAGVAGGGLIVNRRPEDAALVLGPKVGGAAALTEVALGTPSIRFLALFSSRAALNGLVGSADYAAANAFMDAVAAVTRPDRRTVVVSADWPTWHGVGMAKPTAGPSRTWRSRLTPEDWVVAEHRLDGVPLLPATGVVDLLVRAVRQLVPGADAVELTDVTLATPLTVEHPTEVEIELAQEAAGCRATVRSRVDGTPQARTHVTATVVRPAGPGPEPRPLDLVTEAADWAGVPPPGSGETRFALGPRFDVVTGCRRGSDPHTTIGVLELPQRFDADLETHAVHPALLDRALALQLGDGDHIPFVVGRLVVYRDLPAQVLVRHAIRSATGGRQTIDAVLCDSSGRLLVEVTDYTKVSLAGGKRVATGAPVPAAAPDDRPRIGLTTGVTAAQGVEALLRILTEQIPPHVVVVPAEEWTERTPGASPPAPAAPAAVAPAAAPAAATSPPDDRVADPAAGPAADLGADVRRIWAETLGVPEVTGDSDFFTAGGDSLTAIQLIARLQDRFHVALSVSEMFAASTPESLAERIGAKLR